MLAVSACGPSDAYCRGTRFDLEEGTFCVLDPDAADVLRCPDGFFFQRDVGGRTVCGRERVRPEALPPEVCAVLPLGCPAADAGDGDGPDAGTPSDGGLLDSSYDAGSIDAAPCILRAPPDRPAGADDGSDVVRWFALRGIELGTGLRWIELGYDLDGRCTEPWSTDVECAVDPEVGAIPDAIGGVDNTFGSRLIPLLSLAAPDLEPEVAAHFTSGEEGVLVRVEGWNGEPNDPRVAVAVLHAPRGGGPGSDLDGGVRRPLALDGGDVWLAAADSLRGEGLSRPLVEDREGYVADGTIVGRFAEGLALRFTVGTERVRFDAGADPRVDGGRAALVMTLRLRGAILTARPSADGLALQDGILAGRWAMSDVLAMLPDLAVCDTSGGPFRLAEREFRHALDLVASGRTDADRACDALSVGIGMEAVAASVVGVTESPAPFDFCR